MAERAGVSLARAGMRQKGEVWTLGHGRRSLEECIFLLRTHGLQAVEDVRSFPGSRRNPQFGKESLAPALAKEQIEYRHCPGLGGFRKPRDDSPNRGLTNEGFRGYADYMQTEEFRREFDALLSRICSRRSCLVCAETVPWRCHRFLLADLCVLRGLRVTHILGEKKTQLHERTRGFAEHHGVLVYAPEK
ncbi:MAG: DUF488 family protein [Candidatus Omnitrophica bacterium]|nr:DUF488 family protein [Candidatus Omnitrophota bacterium]